MAKNDKDKQKQHAEILKGAVDDFDKFEDFFTSNIKNILIGFAVAALIITVTAIGYSKYQQSVIAKSAELTTAKTVEELEAVIKKYPQINAVYPAKMRLATLFFNSAKYEKASALYKELASTAPVGEIRNRARLNEAYTLEAMNKSLPAAALFAAIGMDASLPAYIKDEANYSAARIYAAAKKNDKAKSCAKAINLSTSGSFWAMQGQKLLQRLN